MTTYRDALVIERRVAHELSAETAFLVDAPQYGLAVSDLGRTFCWGGAAHTIVGLNRHAERHPIITTADDGRTYRWQIVAIQSVLGRQRRRN